MTRAIPPRHSSRGISHKLMADLNKTEDLKDSPAPKTSRATTAKLPESKDSERERMFEELLKDRRHQRRLSVIKYGLIGAIGLGYLSVFGYGMISSKKAETSSPEYAAVIRLSGTIGPSAQISAQRVNPLLEKTFADAKVKGVILNINSPGGTPVQSSLINEKILELKAKHPDKPVVVVGEDMLTSGAYFISAAADRIVVNRSTITGSIGVISSGFGFVDLIEKLGVERRVMTAGAAKDLGDPFKERTPEGLTKQKELIGEIHDHFIDAVKSGRGDRLKGDDDYLFTGAVWGGDRALALGLVDAIGGIDYAAKTYIGTSEVKEIAARKGLLSLLTGNMGVKVSSWFQENEPPLQLKPNQY